MVILHCKREPSARMWGKETGAPGGGTFLDCLPAFLYNQGQQVRMVTSQPPLQLGGKGLGHIITNRCRQKSLRNMSLPNQKRNLQEEVAFALPAFFLPRMCAQCPEAWQPSCSLEDEGHLLRTIEWENGQSLVCVPALYCLSLDLFSKTVKGKQGGRETSQELKLTPKARKKKGPELKMIFWDMTQEETMGFVLFSKWLVPSHSSGLRANHLIGETLH